MIRGFENAKIGRVVACGAGTNSPMIKWAAPPDSTQETIDRRREIAIQASWRHAEWKLSEMIAAPVH